MPKLSRRKQKQLRQEGVDLEFLSRIQPQGNIDFRPDRYFVSGDGVKTTLHVYGYPAEDLERYWLLDLMKIPETRSFLSWYRLDNTELKDEITNSIEEKSSRISSKAKATRNQEEWDEIEDMRHLHRAISKRNIAVLGVYIRIYLFASTKEELFKKEKEIKDKASMFKMTILTGELDCEYHAPFIPASKQIEQLNRRRGQPIPAHTLAGGYFFNHTKLEDERGSYFGWTPTNGAVNFDFLKRDDRRTRSFMIVSGNLKMGQKTFLKKHTDVLYAKGHYIRNFDADKTFKEQTQLQHGLILDLAGEENRINPFQIFPTVTKENGVDVDEEKSYQLHIEKLKNMFSLLNSSVTADNLDTFESVLNRFYVEYNLWFENPKLHLNELRATQLVNEDYPILEDFVLFARSYEREMLVKQQGGAKDEIEQKGVKQIIKTFSNLLQSNGSIFNGATLFQNISAEQVVTFDFSDLKATPHLFNVQVFSVLSLLSADVVNNGKRCKRLMRSNPRLTEMDMKHYILNISEAQTLISPENQRSVKLLADMIESMGHNFAGVVLSVSSLQGILFESGSTQIHDPYVTAVKKIYEMMQYRVFAQTSETSVPLLANALASSMTMSELESLPLLSKGQLFMNIAGVGNIIFNQQLLYQEAERYGNTE
ncbi:virulence factor [Streptococcus sp. O1]|uniref:virulence factor n=1 Tax=Streptococcus sp. O1 TaxID=2928735 RepID=UPI00211B1E0E|nr:virulence factor [Streptococcus sp. O1]MCQ9214492.1 virulence factor [Streptococcus sp. O1]